MPLQRLLGEVEAIEVVGPIQGVELTSVTHDSRRAGTGTLFCCLPGRGTDGHRYAGDAVARGAVAVLCERSLDVSVTQVMVADARRQMARAAAAFWDHPSRRLQVVGVTGTNGKTTTTWLLAAVLEAAGRPAGVIGTLGGPLTTPESPDLQALLASMADQETAAVAMEVSSHALAQGRVDALDFAVAVFTNLSRDHLDFHSSMEEYFAAKLRLFEPGRARSAVINADDPHGRILLDSARIPARPYSLGEVGDLVTGLDRSTGRWRGRRLVVPMGGIANVSNALAAGTAALELGVDEDAVVEGLATAGPVPGRYQVVDRGQPFTVVVDYAHTPDALEQLLLAARASSRRRVVLVFGCGGGRDRDKRPLMGKVAATLADVAVVTSDNPRQEDPQAIIDEVVAGAPGRAEVRTVVDRRTAIAEALRLARAGDVVLVAGKGHELTQVVGSQSLELDDRAVVAGELASLGYGQDLPV